MNRIEALTSAEKIEKADFYKDLVKKIDLSTYKKTPEICSLLNITGREWRTYVEDIMNLYRYGFISKLVVGTQKGYIYTDDPELILSMCKARERQFKSMAYNCYRLRKEVLPLNNYSFKDFLSSVGE